MSFVFPKPVYSKSRNSSSDSDSGSDSDHYHRELPFKSEPDYDLLLVRLSRYAFKRLSPSDQREKVEEISHTVNVEDVQFLEESDEAFRLRTFEELFMKLRFSDQLKLFLSKVIQKLKRDRQLGELLSSFKQLDAEHQQQLIEQIVHRTPANLRNPEETEEEFRLRRFTQLSRDYTRHVYKHFVAWKETDISEEQQVTSNNENGSNWKSCFAEFFLGFSVIWFQGQSASGQDMLIEQLIKGTEGVAIEKRLPEESEEDFKLRRFTELCKHVVDSRVQEKFLENAERKLLDWESNWRFRLIGEPQDSKTAAELLSHLWTFGVSLFSAKYQQQKIDEMSHYVESEVKTERPSAPVETEAVRIRRLTELFNKVPVPARIKLFKKLRKTLSEAKRYSEAVRVFRGLGSKYQTEIIEYMLDRLTVNWEVGVDPDGVIVEKLWGESEEDFRLRRFINLCIKHLSTLKDIIWPEPHRLQVHCASDPYDELLLGVAIIWFKAKCASTRRNPISLLLFGKVEIGYTTERLPEESEEDFRLRRFTDSFKQLDFDLQERVVYNILDMVTYELAHRKRDKRAAVKPPEGRGLFDPEWINYRHTNPRNQVAAATTQGQGATTHAAVGQGTTQPNLVKN